MDPPPVSPVFKLCFHPSELIFLPGVTGSFLMKLTFKTAASLLLATLLVVLVNQECARL